MTRLPTPGSDDGTWGNLLNDFLGVEHNSDGSLKRSSDIDTAKAQASSAVQSVNGHSGQNVSVTASDLGAEQTSNKGIAGGYAGLGSDSKVTLAQSRVAIYNVLDHGIKGDGTDEAAAIQAILDDSTVIGQIFFPRTTNGYRFDTKLQVNVAKNTIRGEHLTSFDASHIATGEAILFKNGFDPVYGSYPWRSPTGAHGGFILKGPSKNNAGSIGIKWYSPSHTSGDVAHQGLDHVLLTNFETLETFGDNAYLIHHFRCHYLAAKVAILMPYGNTNAGEKITYADSVISSDVGVRNGGSGTDIYFDRCSFDYCAGRLIECNSGQIITRGCHFEALQDSDYWFVAGDETALIDLDGVIVIGASKSAYPLGLSRTSTGAFQTDSMFAGIRFNVHVHHLDRLAQGIVVAGNGRVQVNGWSFDPAADPSPGIPVSRSRNLVNTADTSNQFNGWQHLVNVVRDTTQFPTNPTSDYQPSGSIKMTPVNSAGQSSFDDGPLIAAGDLVLASFKYKTQGLASTAYGVLFRLTWFNAQGASIGTAYSSTITANGGDVGWTQFVAPARRAPSRTQTVKIEWLSQDGVGGTTWPLGGPILWVSDMVLNKIC